MACCLAMMTTQTQILSKSFIEQGTWADRAIWVLFFTIVTILSAFVTIPLPFTPVPVTLQTLAVVAGGVVIGRDGKWSQLLYLGLGAVGFPVFADASGGVHVLFGATGGYLIGFVAAAAIAGKWVYPKWNQLSFWGKNWRLLLVSLAIFIPGVAQLCFVTNASLLQGLQWGFFPFILGDLVKTAVVAGIPNKAIRNI